MDFSQGDEEGSISNTPELGAMNGGRSGERPLSNEEYQRYGRQLIMPEIGLNGQLRLKSSKVLVIGVGGLGCPAASYLAGAGVGTLGLADGDIIDVSNLHRQIAHSTDRVGASKVESASQYLKSLNPLVNLRLHGEHLTPQMALQIVGEYDIVLDCTDHPTTRYMISDTCILLQKPLVSASALRIDGQLMVLNYPPAAPGDPKGGPCYRCIFPSPPPAESVLSCGDGGILGPVVGVMGVLQALECIKIISSPAPFHSQTEPLDAAASMLVFSAFSAQQFRTVRLRSRRKKCASCSNERTIAESSLSSGSLDYVAFCGVTNPVDILKPDQRLDAKGFSRVRQQTTVIDVREKVQYELCNLENSVNIPWPDMADWRSRADIPQATLSVLSSTKPLRFICRFGNDSQLAVKKVLDLGIVPNEEQVVDIKGGLSSWRKDVDPDWPDY